MLRTMLGVLSVLLPWRLRRALLIRFFGYEIHPSARIGLSLTVPHVKLTMGENARIGHLNVIRTIDQLQMGEGSLIGSMNWITANLAGFSEGTLDPSIGSRDSRMIMGEYSSISTRHYFDCSDRIEIGEFSDVAGLRSVFLTHHMDIDEGRQACGPIVIGPYNFISSNVVILGGASLPDHSILAAGAVLVGPQTESYSLYAGTPAKLKKGYEEDTGWFQRSKFEILGSRQRWSANPGGKAFKATGGSR